MCILNKLYCYISKVRMWQEHQFLDFALLSVMIGSLVRQLSVHIGFFHHILLLTD